MFNTPFDVSDYLPSGFWGSCPIKNSGDSSFFEQAPACTVRRMVVLFLEVLTANSCLGRYLYIVIYNKVSIETCRWKLSQKCCYFLKKKQKNSNLDIWANIPPDFSNSLLSSLLFLRHTVEPPWGVIATVTSALRHTAMIIPFLCFLLADWGTRATINYESKYENKQTNTSQNCVTWNQWERTQSCYTLQYIS